MTVASLKVRVQRKPTLKVKVLPRFPSAITVQSPILLDTTGGNYGFSLDGTALVASLAGSFLPAGTTAANITFLQAGTGAVTRTVQSKERESVSIYDFGAVGNGIADDILPLRRLVAYCAANGFAGNLTGGTYKIGSYFAVPSNCRLFAQPGTATIYIPTTIDLTGAPTLGGNVAAIFNANYATSDSNISFEGIAFVGDGVSQTKVTPIVFNNVAGFRFEKGSATGFGNVTYYNQGIILYGSSGLRVLNSNFSNNSGDGIAIASGCHDYLVSGCTANNNLDCGFVESLDCYDGITVDNEAYSNTGGGFVSDRCYDTLIGHNSTGGNAWGVRAYIAGAASNHKNIRIVGNTSRTDGVGISAESLTDSIIANNIVASPTTKGIALTSTQRCSAVGNNIKGGLEECIIVNVFSGSTSGENLVSENLTDGGLYGIRELNGGGTLNYNFIGPNACSNASSSNVATVSAPFATPAILTFMGLPNSANLRAALADETGTGPAVFGTGPNITSPTGIVKGDVGLGNVDNTSDATKNAAARTLTNAAISGAANTLTNIGNSSLTNSSVTINGSAVSLGGSVTVGAAPTGTAGGDLSGTYPNPNVAKINGTSMSGLATGILKNTTSTGVPSIAIAADFPTLNQSTTGSAATLTTSRNIDGQAFNGSANITVIAPGTHAASTKATPVDADEIPLVDSAASNVLAKLTWANLKATVKAYYDTVISTLANKTLDNTNTVTLKDTLFTLQDDGDVTKQLRFQLSGIATGTLRTVTIPDANITLARTDAAQTFAGTQTLSGDLTVSGTTQVQAITAFGLVSYAAGARVLSGTEQSFYRPDLSLSWNVGFTANDTLLKWRDTTGAAVITFDTGGNISTAGSLKSTSATAGIGYATGAGGAVTQITSRTTGVTLSKTSGAITLFAAAPAVGTWVSCTVTNTTVAATDTVIVSVKSGTNTYICHVTAVAAGSFQISFTSIVGTASDSPVINFNVIKGVAS